MCAAYKIPNEIVAILPGASMENNFLETLTFPDKLYDVFAYAFYGCKNLKSVLLNYDIKNIGDFAFAQCGIKNIDIPRKVVINHRSFSTANEYLSMLSCTCEIL